MNLTSSVQSGARLRRTWLVTLAIAAGTLVLGACSSGNTRAEGEKTPIRVLFVAGKSGATAKVVNDSIQGMEAAIADVNGGGGGVNGRKLELEVLDTGGDPTRAVSELQRRLSSGKKPDLVIPGVSSVEALGMAPVLTRQKIISINNAASPDLNKPSQYPYHFGYTPSSDRQQAGLKAGLQKLGAKSVVALVGNDAYGKSMGEAVVKNLQGSGISVKIETFNLTDLDLSISYQRAISSKPDAVFFEAIGDPAHRLVEARTVVGATGIPTIGGFGINSTDGGPSNWATDKQNENLYTELFAAQEYVDPAQRSGVLKTFFTRMDERGGVHNAVQAPMIFFDVIRIYAAAAKAAGSTDADAVKKPLESGQARPELTLWKKLTWSTDDHFPTPGADEFVVVPRGKLVDGMFKPEAS